MQPSDETRSRSPWQLPDQSAVPADEDRVLGDQDADGAGDPQPPGRGYPGRGAAFGRGDQAYLPADQAYPQGDQDYLPADQDYRPAGQMPGHPGREEPVPGQQVPPAVSRPAATDQRWGEILTMFVDDPRRSVKLAADVTDQAIDDLVSSVRQRQAALASAWQDSEADTEALRSALRSYRDLWTSLPRDMPSAAGDGSRAAATDAG